MLHRSQVGRHPRGHMLACPWHQIGGFHGARHVPYGPPGRQTPPCPPPGTRRTPAAGCEPVSVRRTTRSARAVAHDPEGCDGAWRATGRCPNRMAAAEVACAMFMAGCYKAGQFGQAHGLNYPCTCEPRLGPTSGFFSGFDSALQRQKDSIVVSTSCMSRLYPPHWPAGKTTFPPFFSAVTDTAMRNS